MAASCAEGVDAAAARAAAPRCSARPVAGLHRGVSPRAVGSSASQHGLCEAAAALKESSRNAGCKTCGEGGASGSLLLASGIGRKESALGGGSNEVGSSTRWIAAPAPETGDCGT